MKPSRTRLTCHAHNRFSPSIALWQHFVGPDRPSLVQQRLSSTASEAVQDAPSKHNGPVRPQAPSGRAQLEAETAEEDRGQPQLSRPIFRKSLVNKGTWYASKVDASVAKNVQTQLAARRAHATASEQLLADARAALQAAEDYTGVVVQPVMPPRSSKAGGALPWSVPREEWNMAGIDRLAIEIERFYGYAKPDHLEALAREQLIEQIRHHVQQTLPDHTLEVFGSERTGLAFATSDIDFRLLRKEELGDAAFSKLPPGAKQRSEAMRDLHLLHYTGLNGHEAYLMSLLRYARYPLISLQDRKTGLDLQVVLSNDTSLSRKFIQEYTEQYPYLRPLYFVVKTMFDVRGLSDVFRGGFGSYTLFMMVVASIQHKPHPRKDTAGGLINFLKFYRDFNTTKQGLSIEPPLIFDKTEEAVVTGKAKSRLERGAASPLPPYMLCLRDPADETNDLGRKALSIKHVQATFRKLSYDLDRDTKINTRASLLDKLVGPSYLLNKERRAKLRQHGNNLSEQMKTSLAAKAKRIREREGKGGSKQAEAGRQGASAVCADNSEVSLQP